MPNILIFQNPRSLEIPIQQILTEVSIWRIHGPGIINTRQMIEFITTHINRTANCYSSIIPSLIGIYKFNLFSIIKVLIIFETFGISIFICFQDIEKIVIAWVNFLANSLK